MTDANTRTDGQRIRVVSWNIELGRNLGQAASEFLSTDRLADADIVLLQEMDDEGTRSLAESLGMESRYTAPDVHPATGRPFGNAILSRWPMSEPAEIRLPHTARFQGQLRAVTAATVDVDGTPVAAYSVHIETVFLGTRRRSTQVRTLGGDAAGHRVSPVVIGGDFNTASQRSRRAFDGELERLGFTRATGDDVRTFTRFGRSYGLDHLYSRGVAVVDSGVAPDPRASDHQPIWAEFALTDSKR